MVHVQYITKVITLRASEDISAYLTDNTLLLHYKYKQINII
jgi:hypothetical protein